MVSSPTFAASALALILAGTGGCAPAPPPATASRAPAQAGPAWLRDVPGDCALGDSGPTMVPTDALAEARRRARARLVTGSAAISTKSALSTGRQDREVILEQAAGWVRDSVIVALWYDAEGKGPERTAGSAYAVACRRASAPDTDSAGWRRAVEAERRGPDWLYALPASERRLCAVGVSGPTMRAEDAGRNADAAAKSELAQALATHAKGATVILDDDVLFGAVTETCPSCGAAAEAAEVIDRWTDERGEGPIPFPGTAYAFLCLNRG